MLLALGGVAAVAVVLRPAGTREPSVAGVGATVPVAVRSLVAARVGAADPAYHAVVSRHAVTVRNRPNRISARFVSSGVAVSHGRGSLGLTFEGFGRGTASSVARVAPTARANRIAYDRGNVVEWYENGPLGLEQGFTVAVRPAGSSGTLRFALGVHGALASSARAVRGGVRFGPLLYSGLVAWDARGARLPARLTYARGHVELAVDDSAARYPVTVDPYVQLARLTTATSTGSDLVGGSVAVAGDTVVVGAPGTSANRGAVLVFVRGAGGWADATQTAKLTASDAAVGDGLGVSVGISSDGQTIVAGAPSATIGVNPSQGAVYVFTKPGGGWADGTQTAKLLASDGAGSDSLGDSVAISGSTVVAGAQAAQVGANPNQGAAYVFVKPGGGWANGTQTGKLTASDGAALDSLGVSVAIDSSTVVVGAPQIPGLSAPPATGAAYVFVQPLGGWGDVTETAKLTASDGADGDGLGASVAVSGDTVVGGASFANAGNGAAYVFTKPGAGWATETQAGKLTASDGAANDEFGAGVAIDGSTVVAGADRVDVALTPGPGSNTDQGAAYVFTKPGGGWADATQSQKLTDSSGGASDFFGANVAVNGATVVAGSRGRNSNTGAAEVFSLVPEAPAITTATPGDQQVTVSWTAPAANGGAAITGYTVTSNPDGKTCTWSTGPLTCTVSGLTNGTAYTFTVTATNAVGTGPASAASSSVTPVASASVPGSPTITTATPGDAQVTVSWSAPGSNGGAAITGYTVTASGGGSHTCTWSSGPLSCTVTGLNNGTAYTFTVTATNSAGTGPSSASSASVTPATVPSEPGIATTTPGDAQVTVSWITPQFDGGAAITGYTVTSNPDGKTCTWSSGPRTCTVTGLTNGVSYTFTATATNSAGTGPASYPGPPVTPTAPVTVPGAPTVTGATPGDGLVTVSWSAPASDGGAAITGYTVTASGGHTCTWSSGPLSCTVTGLSNGTSYTFTVTATNSVGTGAASAASGAVAPASPAPRVCEPGFAGRDCLVVPGSIVVDGKRTLCPVGTYQPLPGQTACLAAPAGSFVGTEGAVGATLCPRGTVSATPGARACTPAAPGYYVDSAGAVFATQCPSGTTSGSGATACTAIPKPVITSATFAIELPNVVVTIVGTGLSGVGLTSSVVATGTAGVLVGSPTPTRIKASFPLGKLLAGTSVQVRVDSVSSDWSKDTFAVPPLPAVTSVYPQTALAGLETYTITLTGTEGVGDAVAKALKDGVKLPCVSTKTSSNVQVCILRPGAAVGTGDQLHFTADSSEPSVAGLTFLGRSPTITSIVATGGTASDITFGATQSLTIVGSNFVATQTSVRFVYAQSGRQAAASCENVSWVSSTIVTCTATIPDRTDGPLSFTATAGGLSSSAFDVTPVRSPQVIAATPRSVQAGTTTEVELRVDHVDAAALGSSGVVTVSAAGHSCTGPTQTTNAANNLVITCLLDTRGVEAGSYDWHVALSAGRPELPVSATAGQLQVAQIPVVSTRLKLSVDFPTTGSSDGTQSRSQQQLLSDLCRTMVSTTSAGCNSGIAKNRISITSVASGYRRTSSLHAASAGKARAVIPWAIGHVRPGRHTVLRGSVGPARFVLRVPRGALKRRAAVGAGALILRHTAASFLPGSRYVGAFDVAWRWAGYTRRPVTMTLAGRGLRAGDVVYQVSRLGLTPVGRVGGNRRVKFTVVYPAPFVIARAKPNAPGYVALTTAGGAYRFGPGHAPVKRVGRLNGPVVASASDALGRGGVMVAATGRVVTWGNVRNRGGIAAKKSHAPIVAAAVLPDGSGYWLLARNGRVFAFGAAPWLGSATTRAGNPARALAVTPDGNGYVVVLEDGSSRSLGNAHRFGVPHRRMATAAPAAAVLTNGGLGLLIVDTDGSVATLGAAISRGGFSSGRFPDSAIVGVHLSPSGRGYTLVSRAGIAYRFGDAKQQAQVDPRPARVPLAAIAG